MPRSGTEDGELSYAVRVEADPEIVFAHFTDPVRIVAWLGEEATLDPRPGGVFRLRFDDEHTALGAYTVVEPPRSVVFTWGFEGDPATPPGSSTVSVTLEPDAGATLVRLVHSGLTGEPRAGHDQGWQRFLPNLSRATEAIG